VRGWGLAGLAWVSACCRAVWVCEGEKDGGFVVREGRGCDG
jgi:hypothetical protein